MRNNILGGLVIFFVVLTCLLILDDITSPQQTKQLSSELSEDYAKKDTELAVVDAQD